jgi:hypothetical protein
MKVTIINDKPSNKSSNDGSVYDRRIGAWARVNKINSEDNSVDVYLDTGVYLQYVPVASKEWVRTGVEVDIDYNTGERDLPPVGSRVFILMPTATFEDCFVLPISSFNTPDKNASAPFLGENIGKIKERITPSGWHITDDYVTGSHKAESPDKKTSLEIDYGDEENPKKENQELHLNIFDNVKADIIAEKKCTLTVFDTEIVIENGKVSIKPKETTIEVDGNATIKASGDTTIEADGKVKIKGTAVEINN